MIKKKKANIQILFLKVFKKNVLLVKNTLLDKRKFKIDFLYVY